MFSQPVSFPPCGLRLVQQVCCFVSERERERERKSTHVSQYLLFRLMATCPLKHSVVHRGGNERYRTGACLMKVGGLEL